MTDITGRLPSAPKGLEADAGLPPAADENDFNEPYRSLSLLALAGFGLAALSAVIVCLGGWIAVAYHHKILFIALVVLAPAIAAVACLLVGIVNPMRILKTAGLALAGTLAVLGLGGLLTYSGSDPWLLPIWLVILPLAGLLVAWVGRTRILTSENTLSGMPLCNWAMGVAAVFSLVYLAYYAATVMAVRLESEVFVKQWAEHLEKGEVDGAFLLTLPEDKRPRDPTKTRSDLETMFNQPGPRGEGLYGTFGSKDYVRLIAGAPGDAKVESPRLMEWKYEDGEFQVLYSCHVTSSLCTFDMDIFARGIVSAKGQFQGRQWFVDLMRTGRKSSDRPQFTAKGEIVREQSVPAHDFAEAWIKKWRSDDDEAYLETLSPAGRKEILVRRGLAGAALGSGGHWIKGAPYADGALVEADPKAFFAARSAYRELIPAKLRDSFRPGADKPKAMLNPSAVFPFMQSTADSQRYLFDTRMLFDKEAPPVEVDARVVVECDVASLESKEPQWRVIQVQLIRARTYQPQQAPEVPIEPGGPGGPMGPGGPLGPGGPGGGKQPELP